MQGAHRQSASLAQLVEQLTLNQFVRGSSPRGGTEKQPVEGCFFLCQSRACGNTPDKKNTRSVLAAGVFFEDMVPIN